MEDFISWKEKLKENSDIITVISKYIPLQKRGKTWWGNCPFHFEKTPSFAVNEIDQYYHCFGCGVSGDVINFVSKYESCEFMEACEILAKDANMKMPVFKEDENVAKLKKEKEVSYKVLKDAAIYYYNNLFLPQSKLAQEYVRKRNLDAETIKAFAVGYSLGWNEIIDNLTKKGYSISDLKTAGIIEERNGKYNDAYAKRLIFPIINSNSDVVGFSARLLEKADFAKYKNTTQTVVFDKSKVLYGINNIKKEKQSTNLSEIIIVEGQMDLISLYKSGIKNAVATMGTSLTSLHAKELKRYCDKVILCFDGDGAGKKATLRSIDILNSAGLEVYVSSLPTGVDPDDYVNKYGKGEFLNVMSQAKHWVEYLILNFANSYDLNKPNEKSDFIINALNVVKKLESSSEQDVYLDLIKRISNISTSVLKQDLNNLDSAKTTTETKKEPEPEQDLKENKYVKAVKFVMASLLHKQNYAKLSDDIKQGLLNSDYLKIYEYIENQIKNSDIPKIAKIYDIIEDVENNKDIKDIIDYKFITEMQNEQYFSDCVKTIKISTLLQLQTELTEKLKTVRDLSERREVAKQLQDIIIKIKKT